MLHFDIFLIPLFSLHTTVFWKYNFSLFVIHYFFSKTLFIYKCFSNCNAYYKQEYKVVSPIQYTYFPFLFFKFWIPHLPWCSLISDKTFSCKANYPTYVTMNKPTDKIYVPVIHKIFSISKNENMKVVDLNEFYICFITYKFLYKPLWIKVINSIWLLCEVGVWTDRF